MEHPQRPPFRAVAPSLRGVCDRAPNVVAWLGCLAVLIGCAALANTVVPVNFVSPAQATIFTPAVVGLIGAAGLLGAWLAEQTGFPDPLGDDVPLRRRFGIPIAAGLGFGALLLVIDLMSGMSRIQAERFGVSSVVVPPPGGLLVYTAGAIAMEVILRLLPIPLLLWIISSRLLRGRAQEPTFWALAVLTSLVEPLLQSAVTTVLPAPAFAAVVAHQIGVNLAQAACFRRYGLLAAIALRLGFYLIYDGVGAGLR